MQHHVYNIVRHLVILLVLMTGLVPVGVFAQVSSSVDGENSEQQQSSVPSIVEVPDTLEDVQKESLRVGEQVLGLLPGTVGNIWKTEVLPVWRTMWQGVQEFWEQKARSVVQNVVDTIQRMLGREIEQRVPIIEQELQKEAREFGKEVQNTGDQAKQSLWQRFRALFTEEE